MQVFKKRLLTRTLPSVTVPQLDPENRCIP